MENNIFYHITPKENVGSILEEGLRPGSAVGHNNEWHGMKGDPSYLYLFSQDSGYLRTKALSTWIYTPYALLKEKVSGKKGKMFLLPDRSSLLKVELPEGFTLERDYDQVDVYRKYGPKELERQLKALSGREEIPRDVMRDDVSIRRFLDEIPASTWDKNSGSYRTSSAIHPQCISEVSWLDLLLRR